MRPSWVMQAVRGTSRCLTFHIPSSVKEEAAMWQKKEEEAAAKGFARRDGEEDQVLMGKRFAAMEKSTAGVPVANLPPIQREATEFDDYQRSTSDFTSLVTPHGMTAKSSLGAGFGMKEDRRLGFLRPRRVLQPNADSTSIVPKFDENGHLIDETLTPYQVMQKRKEYLKSFDGTTMSSKEHFLLVDLDFQKDSILFGDTREEFERNVTKLKNVIIAYSRWERTDQLYRGITVMVKVLTLWVLMESLQQYYEVQLFAAHYDDFVEAIEAEMAALEQKRRRDFAEAALELRRHPPDFAPVLEAIAQERNRVNGVEAKRAMAALEQHEKETTNSEGRGIASLAWDAWKANVGGESDPMKTAAVEASSSSAIHVKDPDTPHPMDTTYETQYLERKHKADELREMRRLATSAEPPTTEPFRSHVWGRLKGIFHPLQQPHQHRFSIDELIHYSYAASPTSIQSMRAMRRILLPRSEDVVQLVREEMVDYKRLKEEQAAHPL